MHIQQEGDRPVFRKSIIAIATVATVAAIALPSVASAKKGGGGGHHRFRSFVGVTVLGTSYAATSCYRYRWIETCAGSS